MKYNLNNFKLKRTSILEEKITEFQNTEPVKVNRSIAEKAVQNKGRRFGFYGVAGVSVKTDEDPNDENIGG